MNSYKKLLFSLLFLLPSLAFSFCYKDETPWFTGPLITGSPTNQPPKTFNMQPYLFIRDSYGAYNRSYHFTRTPNIFTLHANSSFQTGITDWLDFTLYLNYFYRERRGQTTHRIGDTTTELGFFLLSDKRGTFQPNVRITLSETFPTGKYQKLDEVKRIIEATSGGTYETSLSLNVGKTVYWLIEHPMSFRGQLAYSIPTNVDVKGFNAYGGGFGTDGTVKPGRTFLINFGYEFSFTRHFALACDLSNVFATKTSFSGTPGTNDRGTAARTGFGSKTQISVAPALEYNFNEDYGLIAGTWFSVKGRNAVKFFSYVISFDMNF